MANLHSWVKNFSVRPKQRKEEDFWQNYHDDEEADYSWVRQVIIAVIIFFGIYLAHLSGTDLGRGTVNAVERVLTTPMDYAYWLNKGRDYGVRYFPNAVSWEKVPLIEDVRSVVSKPADPLLYMSRPVEGELKLGYGLYNDPDSKEEIFHEGIEIKAAVGANVHAAAPGKVKIIKDNGALGQMIILEHGEGMETVYSYLGEVLVTNEELVSQRQLIARVGKVRKNNAQNTANEASLYFEVRKDGQTIDPLTRIGEGLPGLSSKLPK